MGKKSKQKSSQKAVKLPLSQFLGDQVGSVRVSAKSSHLDDDDDDDRVKHETIVLPTAPRQAMGPNIDMERVPSSPPYIAYVANLPFEVEDIDIQRFFNDVMIKSIRLPREGGENGRFKGFGYVEFESRHDLLEALSKNEDMMRNRKIRVDIAEEEGGSRKERGNFTRGEEREDRSGGVSDWRAARDPPSNFDNDRNDRGGYGNRYESSDYDRNKFGRDRDYDDRRGRYGSGRGGSYGRSFGGKDEDKWRPPNKSPPRERKKLNLQPRTKAVEEKVDAQPAAPSSSIFGAAKPVDTYNKEKEIEEKLQKKVETPAKKETKPAADIFGAAKPVDTAAREREIEEKLKKQGLSEGGKDKYEPPRKDFRYSDRKNRSRESSPRSNNAMGRRNRSRTPSPSYRRRTPSPSYRKRTPSPSYRKRTPSPSYRKRTPSPSYRKRTPSPSYRRRTPSPSGRRSPSPSYRENSKSRNSSPQRNDRNYQRERSSSPYGNDRNSSRDNRNYYDRDRSPSRPIDNEYSSDDKDLSPRRSDSRNKSRRSNDRSISPRRSENRDKSPRRRSDEREYSPRQSDNRVYSPPRRLDNRDSSPRRSDNYSKRYDSRNYSPRSDCPRRNDYSPPRSNYNRKYDFSRRSDRDYSPKRQDYTKRYDNRNYSPRRSNMGRSPPRRDYSPRRNDNRNWPERDRPSTYSSNRRDISPRNDKYTPRRSAPDSYSKFEKNYTLKGDDRHYESNDLDRNDNKDNKYRPPKQNMDAKYRRDDKKPETTSHIDTNEKSAEKSKPTEKKSKKKKGKNEDVPINTANKFAGLNLEDEEI